MRLRWLSSCAALSFGLLLSCSSTPEGSIVIVTGDETDVFSRAPAPVTLVTEKIGTDGKRTEIARTPLPADTIDLGEPQRTEIGALSLSGIDAAGKPLVRGETLFVQWGALENASLEVFVQRTGELARMPRGPAAFDALAATIVVGRYVLAANGTSTMLYDLLGLKPLSSSPVFPRPARSIASVGTAALVIDDAGATAFELSDGTSNVLEPPTGGTFAEIAGGQTFMAPDGTQYIVGATRASGGATARILVLSPKGSGSFAALSAPREGACATYVEGRGLVVVGGDASAAGAEVLAAGASVATPLPFPADAVKGCGAATLDNAHVAVVGDGEPVHVLDLACTTDCKPAAWPAPVPLVRAEAQPLAPDALFVVGDDADGATHAYRASATELREVPLRIARRGARLLATPVGALAVVGGGAPGIEQYLE